MKRLVFKQLKVRKPPSPTRERVVLIRKPPRVDNVIKPIPQRAKEKSVNISQKIASRNRYRENAGVVMDSCLDNLEKLDSLASRIVVTLPNGNTKEIKGFTVTGIGEPLKSTGVTITRWLKRGMIPNPFLTTSRGQAYHVEEVRVMVRIIGNHQLEFRQYRDDHTDIKRKLFSEIADVRRGLFLDK